MSDAPSIYSCLCVRFFSQDLVCFRRYELLRAMLHRYVIGYFILVTILICLLDLRGALEVVPPYGTVIINVMAVVSATACHLAMSVWYEWRHDCKSHLVVNASPVLMKGTIVGVAMSEVVSRGMFGTPGLSLAQLAFLLIFHYFLVELFIGLVMFLVMPKVLSDLRGVPIRSVTESHRFTQDALPQDVVLPTQAGEVPDWAEIGGKRIAMAELMHIEAEGNYIRVTTARKRLYLPGPFGPVAEALSPEFGLRISRSDWVACSAVAELRRDGAEMRLMLKNGAEVQVPKNRRKAVLAWFDECPDVQAALFVDGNKIDPQRAVA